MFDNAIFSMFSSRGLQKKSYKIAATSIDIDAISFSASQPNPHSLDVYSRQ